MGEPPSLPDTASKTKWSAKKSPQSPDNKIALRERGSLQWLGKQEVEQIMGQFKPARFKRVFLAHAC